MVNKMLFTAVSLAIQVSWAQNILDVFDDKAEEETYLRELQAELEEDRRNLDSDSIYRRDLHGLDMRNDLRALEGTDDEDDDEDADDADDDAADADGDTVSEDEQEEVKENWANFATGPHQLAWFRSDHYSEKCRKAKMEDLWGRLVPNEASNDVEPLPYWYAKHP